MEHSSNSEVCYKVKCEPKCKTGDCKVNKLNALDAQEIHCKFSNAVVKVQSEFILLGGAGGPPPVPITTATGLTPLGAGTRTDKIIESNGFFIKGHYIIVPAHAVLLPPSLTSIVNRYPLADPANTTLGQIKDLMIRASRIFVSVYDVNGKGFSFVYEANLIGVDGAGDIAVLKIDSCGGWNSCNPKIEKCHPYLRFGSSKNSNTGERVYLIGNSVGNSNNALVEGILSDSKYVDSTGTILPQSLLVSAPAYAAASGLPVLNAEGNVIAMQTANLSAVDINTAQIDSLSELGLLVGPTENFMKRVIKNLIKGTSNRCKNQRVELINDAIGSYYKYKKAYAGVAYDLFQGYMYDVTTEYGMMTPLSDQPRIRLSATGAFLNVPNCKQLLGVRVLGLAGLNPLDGGVVNGFYYVPGGTGAAPLVDFLPVSPLLGKLTPGDQITHIEGIELGDLKYQVAPAAITWRLYPGDRVEFKYRKGGNALNSATNDLPDSYENINSVSVILNDYPALMDYPWYAIHRFPLLAADGFAFGTQESDPQLPQLGNDTKFRPAF